MKLDKNLFCSNCGSKNIDLFFDNKENQCKCRNCDYSWTFQLSPKQKNKANLLSIKIAWVVSIIIFISTLIGFFYIFLNSIPSY